MVKTWFKSRQPLCRMLLTNGSPAGIGISEQSGRGSLPDFRLPTDGLQRPQAPCGKGVDRLAWYARPIAGRSWELVLGARYGYPRGLAPRRNPPSTGTTLPVTYLDIGLTRNKTTSATSSGEPIRSSGIRRVAAILACSVL
jgi:hypothetical protein